MEHLFLGGKNKPGKTLLRASVMCICLLFCATGAFGEDGGPEELGPTDTHALSKTGLNQKVLVIYVHANDYPILSGDLTTLNSSEDKKVADFKSWYYESSWNQLTLDVEQKRTTGNNWYKLPKGILDYASPGGVRAMEARDSSQASTSNPTPPASVSATAAAPSTGDPASEYDSTKAGNYWYAVSAFKNGVESRLTRIGSSLAVASGDIVKLTITRAAANDATRYIIYRTWKGQGDSLNNYERIGYANVTGATDSFTHTGKSLESLANHGTLLTDAMTAAAADVANFENYSGIIAIIHSPFLRGQSAGAVTFTVNSTQFKIQTINQSSSTGFGRFTHEIGHWLVLPDQYDPYTAGARGYWTTMDGADDREYATWEKDYGLGWILDPANVKSLQRPAPGSPDLNVTYKVLPTAVKDTAADIYTALKIKSSDTVHYYVEGRDKIGMNVSDASAANHVVVMEAVDSWPPGIYPKRTLNGQKVLASGDAAYKPDPTVEITFSGTNAGPPETYNVNVKIKAEEQPDPSITPWSAPPWETTDIWIDSEREGGGWDDPATATPKPANGEAAWVNHVNRVYAKITNKGAAEAKDVQVRFRVNTPGGIGAAGQYVDLPNPAKITIPAGGSKNVYADWTPTVGDHTCIQVEIEHIAGEKDIFNNFAQENITSFYTGNESPWKPVRFPVRVANPFDRPQKVYLEINGLEKGWTALFDHKWVMLGPKGIKTVYVTITPPADATVCTKRTLDVYGLTQIDDYIQVYGGMNPVIRLANPIEFLRFRVEEDKEQSSRKGKAHRFQGITRPTLKNAEIAVIMTDEDGRYKVVFTRTDGTGFFRGTFITDSRGIWTVQPYYAGDDCNAPTEGKSVAVYVPETGGKAGGSPYLVGTYDLRNKANTVVHLVNSRGEYMKAQVMFFDDNEKPLKCVSENLSPNDLFELDLRRLRLPEKFGVVKVLSWVGDDPADGMVGFQRHIAGRAGVTESNMEAGPATITGEDRKIFSEMCR